MTRALRGLIQHWRKEANDFLYVARERNEMGDEEEAMLCDVEARRLRTCADELEAALATERK